MMYKSIEDIVNQMVDIKDRTLALSKLNSQSSSAIWRLIMFVVANAIYILVRLFEQHEREVTGIIERLKPHSLLWYGNLAKRFQYGFNLLPDSDQFDNAGKTDGEIKASKIVRHSAVTPIKDGLLVKVATGTDYLKPLDASELSALRNYLERTGDAGVYLDVMSAEADRVRFTMDIYYNPLLLNEQGERLDGSSATPVADAVNSYLMRLPFNGELVLTYLTDVLQEVAGVVIPVITLSEYRYGNLDWQPIAVKYLPYAGYLRVYDVENDLKINYIAQNPYE